jgi:hypothetical protein
MSKLQVIGNNYKVFNETRATVYFEILLDAYPDVTLSCQSVRLSQASVVSIHGNKKGPTENHFIVKINTTNVKDNVKLKCTLKNKAGSQTTGFLIYKQGKLTKTKPCGNSSPHVR